MTHQEFLEQVDAYALGALEGGEARALEQHLANEGPHPLCEAALARARETVATLAADLKPVTPPPRVWDGIARSIAQGEEPARRAPPPREPVDEQPRDPVGAARRIPTWVYGLAAAAVLTIVVSGVTVRQAYRSASLASVSAAECRKELADLRIDALRKEDAIQLLLEPGTQLVSLKATPDATGPLAQSSGVVIFNPRGRALFLGKSFPGQPTRDYELWVLRDSKTLAAGLLRTGPDGRVFADVRPEALTSGRPQKFAVSIEQPGGERDAPRGPVVFVGAVAAP